MPGEERQLQKQHFRQSIKRGNTVTRNRRRENAFFFLRLSGEKTRTVQVELILEPTIFLLYRIK